jgi:hypothetical protein
MRTATLRLEGIADHLGDKRRHLQRLPADRVDPRDYELLFTEAPRPWVERLVPDDGSALSRQRLAGQKDFREANSIGSRGVFWHYTLREGEVYEVHQLTGWKKSRNWFCRVGESGRVEEITRAEAEAWLRSAT